MLKGKPIAFDCSKEDALDTLGQILQHQPRLTSQAASWSGIYLSYHYQPPGESLEAVSKQHGIAIFTEMPTPSQVERKIGECVQREQVVQGDVLVVPANIGHRAQWDTAGSVILLGLEPMIVAHAVHEAVDPDGVEVTPHFATPDPLIYQLGLTLKSELQSNAFCSRLYAETIANVLAVHLLRHYCAQQLTLRDYADGLSKSKLRQVKDYINAHLNQDLGLAELAALVQMSRHYFSHLFKQSTGLTPHQYVIRCRVERAKQLLLKGELTIAEIAYLVGFANQSHLNRHFKRLLGVTPKAIGQR